MYIHSNKKKLRHCEICTFLTVTFEAEPFKKYIVVINLESVPLKHLKFIKSRAQRLKREFEKYW